MNWIKKFQWVLLYSHVQPGGYKIKFDNIGCSRLILCKRPTILKFGLKKSELIARNIVMTCLKIIIFLLEFLPH